MIEKMAVSLINQIAEERLIEEEEKEDYIYAFICILEKFITIGTIILISIMFQMFIPTILFLISFLSLRKRTGGYHLNTFGKCYLGTVAAYIIILYLGPILAKNLHLLLEILAFAICSIEMIGTVNHPNMNLNAVELAEEKKLSRLLVLMIGSVIYFCVLLQVDIIYISFMSIAVFLCAALLIIAKFIKQEVKENEKS